MISLGVTKACFNPRPLLLTGESAVQGLAASVGLEFQSTPVIANGRIPGSDSHHAAQQAFQSTPVIANGRIGCPACHHGQDTGFNPRPLLLTGESSKPKRCIWPFPKFQSTPVIANGRIDQQREQLAVERSFNPRPLLLTGESLNTSGLLATLSVSIHARYC